MVSSAQQRMIRTSNIEQDGASEHSKTRPSHPALVHQTSVMQADLCSLAPESDAFMTIYFWSWVAHFAGKNKHKVILGIQPYATTVHTEERSLSFKNKHC